MTHTGRVSKDSLGGVAPVCAAAPLATGEDSVTVPPTIELLEKSTEEEVFATVTTTSVSGSLRKVLGGTAIYFGGTFLITFPRIFLIPVYTRYLTPQQYGLLGAVNAVTSLTTMFLLLGLDGATIREYYEYRDKPRALRQYLATALLFMAALNVVAISLLFMIGPRAFGRIFPDNKVPFYPYLALGILCAGATCFFRMLMGLLQAKQRAVSFAFAQIGRFVLLVGITLVLLIWFRKGPEAPLWGEFAGTLAVFLVLAYAVFRRTAMGGAEVGGGVAVAQPLTAGLKRLRLLFDFNKLKPALAFGLPLVPHEMSNWIMSLSDRMIIGRYRPMQELGTYVLGYSLAMGMGVLVGALNTAYYPFFLSTINGDPAGARAVFSRMASIYVAGVGAACLIAMLFARQILQLIAPAAYSKASNILVVVVLAYFLQGLYMLTVLPYYHCRLTRRIPIFSATAAFCNIGLNLVLVPRFGSIAAAWTTLVAYALLFLFVCLTAQKLYPIEYKLGSFWLPTLLVIALGLSCNNQQLIVKVTALLTFFTYVLLTNFKSWKLARAVWPAS